METPQEEIEQPIEDSLPPEEPPPKPDPEVEKRAAMQGWVPKEDFRGDKERWIPADEFVKRADNLMPIMKGQLKKYETKIETLEKALDEQKKITKKVVEIQGKYSKDFYDSKLEEIGIQKRQAVVSGDAELYDRLTQQETKIQRPETIEVPKASEPQDVPEVARWKSENAHWYGKDPELTEYADIISDRIGKKGHSYNPYEFCEAVKEKVKVMFPDKFGGTKQSSNVDESNTRGTDTKHTKGKTYNDLPSDAKQQCMRMLKEIPGFTKEKYVKDYFEEA